MALPPHVSRNLERPDGRAEFERARREHKAALPTSTSAAAAIGLLDLGSALDSGVERCKRDLLASALCWNENNQTTITWICRQHREIAEMGVRVAETLRAEGGGDAAIVERIAALTLHHWAEAIKWSQARERTDYAVVHDVMRHAIARGRQRTAINWIADGRGRATTLEALFFRALLLDRFATGSLTRAQVELFDAWLWEWTGALHGDPAPHEGGALRVDLDQNTGLREGPRVDAGESLYLPLVPLERRRQEVIDSLHRGRIVPQHGCASDFRVEEHVALLDHLQRAFRINSEKRAARRHVAGTKIEVWVGMQEILARGVGIGTETGRFRAVNLVAPSIDEQARARFSESTRRYLWLADASATGLGFQAMGDDAAGIAIGDVLGWRAVAGGALVLGTVARLMPGAAGAPLAIGVRVLTEAAHPLPLVEMVGFSAGEASGTYLFIPGSDSAGTGDAFLLPESTFEQRSTYRTQAGGHDYTLRFNRVRARGRGWIAAGFEMLTARDITPKGTVQENDEDRPFPMLEIYLPD